MGQRKQRTTEQLAYIIIVAFVIDVVSTLCNGIYGTSEKRRLEWKKR